MQLLQAQANVKGRRRYGMGLFDSLTGTKCPPKGTPVLSPQAVQNRLSPLSGFYPILLVTRISTLCTPLAKTLGLKYKT
jgi:hypothetical protein